MTEARARSIAADIDTMLREAAAARATGDLAAADALYRGVLTLDPLHRDAIRHHVVLAAQRGCPEDALAALNNASRADPLDAEFPFGRALVLAASGRTEAAIAAYDQAIALRPDDYLFREGRAGLLVVAGRPDDALADHDAAIALRPDVVEPRMARAGLLERARRFEEALAAYDRVIELREDFAQGWFAKALLLLTLGRYREGWPLYEWRWFVPDAPGPARLFAQPMWDGSPLGERTLYVHIEQGLGDSIQFYRFVRQAMRSGRVVLGVSERLAALFASQPDAPEVIVTGQTLPRFDVYCPMMSLPWLLGNDLETIPRPPYLRADPGRVERWRARLAPKHGRPRIGIVWSGNRRHANDRMRSMPLPAMLASLGLGSPGLASPDSAPGLAMSGPDLSIVSLQIDVPESDRARLRETARVLDLGGDLEDLADTAAVISQLDLVISVDTAVAHLAGAMGKPVWVLLPRQADWRWMLDRADSPWYPSARLFRQDHEGDWMTVAAQVRQALRGLTVPS